MKGDREKMRGEVWLYARQRVFGPSRSSYSTVNIILLTPKVGSMAGMDVCVNTTKLKMASLLVSLASCYFV